MSRSLKAKNTGMNSRLLFTIFLTFLCQLVVSEDYYELLGISRDASNTEIRKAFKKLALKLHPDKNTEDPQAHEKFTAINKAYEVLKDEELRKKYDVYGEEGLKDDHFGGGHYQSWNYFNEEFGKIIVLSSFSMSNNYYYLFHLTANAKILLHQLWCSFSFLMFLLQHEFHHGSRTTKALVQFILDSLEVNLFDLWDGNFEEQIKHNDQPWLIDFCAIGEDCISQDTRIKVSAILDNLVNIGVIDCGTNSRLCEEIGYNDKLVYFKGDVGPEKGEVSFIVALLINSIEKGLKNSGLIGDLASVMKIKKNLAAATEIPWVLHFDKGPMDNLEMRKLPAFTTDVNVGHVDCSKEQEICQQVHVRKYPMVALFKTHGHYEWHHGRFTAHDIAVFAKESASSSVQTLGPDDFPAKISKPDLPFFVDFFAPWCPPCMRLLPEYRKAARSFDDSEVGFGTVDCTIHINLCHMYNIRSYPTTILYNNSIPHQFSGHHTAADLVEFVEVSKPFNRVKDPYFYVPASARCLRPMQSQKRRSFGFFFFATKTFTQNRDKFTYTDVSLYLLQLLDGRVKAGKVDCEQDYHLCSEAGVRAYPTVKIYLGSPEKGMTQPVNGHLNVESQNPQQIQSLALRALKDYKEDLASRKSKKTKSKKKHRGKPDHDEF
ncbi:PREDICTED: dnaJ homolog subfamily C member 10-like [Acropora digitifera]|uniref:dnaJ homolog subfamily C member 10-like n=1 Tax=Acropora digitifera TaxID=70779 RepID=UPI00077A2E97|nr:PREDICTED: dnaJ homolog subfamily C member 10-like [Acropora digitifera]